MSQIRHNYNAHIVGTYKFTLEEVMKRMKTILAVAGLIWVMSHGFPIFEGEQIRSALNKKYDDYHVIDRKENVVTVRVKDCFHTVTVANGNVTNETKMCDKR